MASSSQAISETHFSRSADGDSPVQHRLAFHGPTSMAISWNTYEAVQTPTIRYGFSKDALIFSARSKVSTTYPTSRTWNNHVIVEGLLPNTRYYYKVKSSSDGSDKSKGQDQVYSFKTPRLKGDRTPYTAALVVDMGVMGSDGLSTTVGKGAANPLKPGETNTIQRLIAEKDSYEFVVHPGDLAYSDYWLKEVVQGYLPGNISAGPELYEKLNEEFYDQLQPVTSEKPYMVGPGNHEANCDNGGYKNYTESICPMGQTNFTGYINRFNMPSAVSGGQGNFWYSFDYGMTHYVIFDTETDLGLGLVGPDELGGGANDNEGPFGATMNAQRDWLIKDLRSVNRKLTPWVVAAGHRPWYISAAAKNLCQPCQQSIEPILIEYGVDVVLHGHVHAYERTAPIRNGTVDPNELNNPSSPWYIINGAAGHYDGLDSLATPRANFSRASIDTLYGFSRLIFHNETHLTQEFVSSATGQVMDSATLYKKRK
ncbi:metallophosphoesterase [Violaceomyces palustris]|uniref:Metallophosphoesterase n=1 Tax=Violaceomyces palustris TaxID=1673888 RepID=A0ACD0NPU5_9BASI|nr:metallophosphoesterase [Violaceomyces palustris]